MRKRLVSLLALVALSGCAGIYPPMPARYAANDDPDGNAAAAARQRRDDERRLVGVNFLVLPGSLVCRTSEEASGANLGYTAGCEASRGGWARSIALGTTPGALALRLDGGRTGWVHSSELVNCLTFEVARRRIPDMPPDPHCAPLAPARVPDVF